MEKWILLLALLMVSENSLGQVEQANKPLKLKHAEPLYMDLIRDLGARKGEKEINLGLNYAGDDGYSELGGFMEYEFAVANRWGMEVEADLSFYNIYHEMQAADVPHNRIESLKWANQFTFLVSAKWQTSMAIALIHEFRFHSFNSIRQQHRLMKGTAENAVLIMAKRWGKHIHSLIYTGPEWFFSSGTVNDYLGYQLHSSVHYVWRGGHFVGIECNQEKDQIGWQTVFHPQVKFSITNEFAIGLVTGVPLGNATENISFMTRLVWEL